MDEAGTEIEDVCKKIGLSVPLVDVPVKEVQDADGCPQPHALHGTVELADLVVGHAGKEVGHGKGDAHKPSPADPKGNPVNGKGNGCV